MLKVEIFVESGNLASAFAYKKFVKENKNIEIISVNVLNNNHILLTYKEY